MVPGSRNSGEHASTASQANGYSRTAILSDNDVRILLQLRTQEIMPQPELLAARSATAKPLRWRRCMDTGIFARDHALLGASDEDRWVTSKVDLLG
jgi:hypothetical protein